MINPEHSWQILYSAAAHANALIPGVLVSIRVAELPKESPYRQITGTLIGTLYAYHPERTERPYEVELRGGEREHFEAIQLEVVREEQITPQAQERATKRKWLEAIKYYPCPTGDDRAILLVDALNETEPLRDMLGNLQYYCPTCLHVISVDKDRNIVSGINDTH